ncbi:MAG: hypothetical protein M3158_12280 [Pseudomonadota bacterium]|nr:hypothetical protein [Pseudomonadota bacterium]
MLTLVQITALVLFVLLVFALVRLTRTRETAADRQSAVLQPAPTPAWETLPTRLEVGAADRRTQGEPGGRAISRPLAAGRPPLSAVPQSAGGPRPAPRGDRASPALAAEERNTNGSAALNDGGLWDLVVRLRDQAAVLKAERDTQRIEIGRLRAALGEAAREIEALRSTGGARATPEPRLPNVNVYELRANRRR